MNEGTGYMTKGVGAYKVDQDIGVRAMRRAI
jgi:hypothetical protein